jgi:hypothetical protein
VLAAALSAAALAPFLPWLAPLVPGCPFHLATGVPCPGCGTTRAALALARGDVLGALAFNPLAALGIPRPVNVQFVNTAEADGGLGGGPHPATA